MQHAVPKFTIAYVTLIVVINYIFSIVPKEHIHDFEFFIAIFVGLVFVVRDYAQREIGHWVLAAMFLAGGVSYYMADPFVALASVSAFLISELADWAVYTFTKWPLSKRILISSAVGTPIDTVVFLGMIGLLEVWSVIVYSSAKMIGALIVWFIIRRRETKKVQAAA
ncbi:MAG: preQ0 transporter [Rhodospirillales bacterium]